LHNYHLAQTNCLSHSMLHKKKGWLWIASYPSIYIQGSIFFTPTVSNIYINNTSTKYFLFPPCQLGACLVSRLSLNFMWKIMLVLFIRCSLRNYSYLLFILHCIHTVHNFSKDIILMFIQITISSLHIRPCHRMRNSL
jgi:hypothetical protein